jgi:hypothetical protein
MDERAFLRIQAIRAVLAAEDAIREAQRATLEAREACRAAGLPRAAEIATGVGQILWADEVEVRRSGDGTALRMSRHLAITEVAP